MLWHLAVRLPPPRNAAVTSVSACVALQQGPDSLVLSIGDPHSSCSGHQQHWSSQRSHLPLSLSLQQHCPGTLRDIGCGSRVARGVKQMMPLLAQRHLLLALAFAVLEARCGGSPHFTARAALPILGLLLGTGWCSPACSLTPCRWRGCVVPPAAQHGEQRMGLGGGRGSRPAAQGLFLPGGRRKCCCKQIARQVESDFPAMSCCARWGLPGAVGQGCLRCVAIPSLQG